MIEHLVIGAGQVGQAIAEVLRLGYGDQVRIRDVEPEADDPERVRMVHVCFGYSDAFDAAVLQIHERYRPEIMVIHSTVPVGTSRSLGACHSPVRGRHPDLVPSLLRFVKFFAGHGAVDAAFAFKACDVPVELIEDPETTEAGKLWELLLYGMAIIAQKEMFNWCERAGADPRIAYERFADTYNDAYRQLGVHHVIRPIIRPEPGPIGGHCVIPGLRLVDHPFAALVDDLNEEYA